MENISKTPVPQAFDVPCETLVSNAKHSQSVPLLLKEKGHAGKKDNFIPEKSRLFTLIELLVNAACLYNCSSMLSLWSGAFVRMSTDKYGRVRSQALQNTAGFAQQQNTPLFLKEKGSARGKENFFSREKNSENTCRRCFFVL